MNPIPVCSHPKVNAHEELWTISGLPVDGVRVPLRRFRKSHHFVPASHDPDALDHRRVQPRREIRAHAGVPWAYHSYPNVEKGKVETACPSSKA
jgi:hypothetical protein